MDTHEACYTTLGLAPGATFAEVKRAYRTLVKRWHPDRFAAEAERQQQALEHFYAITSAYETLRALHAVSAGTPPPAPWWLQRVASWPGVGAVCLGVGTLVIVGLWVFPFTPRQPAPSFSLASRPGIVAQSLYKHEHITIGSTQDDVLTIQGMPTWATDRMWEYSGSRLYFNAGRVTGWEIWPASPLKVQLLPAIPIDPVPAFFTVGSTKDEVLAVQGTPTRVTEGWAGWPHRRPLQVADVFTDGRFMALDWWRAHGLRSFLAVPMVFEEALLGVLALSSSQPLPFGPDEQYLLHSFAAQAAIALNNARLFNDSKARPPCWHKPMWRSSVKSPSVSRCGPNSKRAPCSKP